MSTLHIAVVGASGRMGVRVCALAMADATLSLVAPIVRDGSPLIGARAVPLDRAPAFVERARAVGAHVVIDFSTPSALRETAAYAADHRAALVIGTTGLLPEHEAIVRATAAIVPVLHTPNTSIGVAAVAMAAAHLARSLGVGYRASIVESHHVYKKDAPSGTAKRLASALRGAGADLPDDQIHAIRAGDTIGTHVITLSGPGESIELVHRATSRDLFAIGALRAAKWLSGKPAGLYRIEDTF